MDKMVADMKKIYHKMILSNLWYMMYKQSCFSCILIISLKIQFDKLLYPLETQGCYGI